MTRASRPRVQSSLPSSSQFSLHTPIEPPTTGSDAHPPALPVAHTHTHRTSLPSPLSDAGVAAPVDRFHTGGGGGSTAYIPQAPNSPVSYAPTTPSEAAFSHHPASPPPPASFYPPAPSSPHGEQHQHFQPPPLPQSAQYQEPQYTGQQYYVSQYQQQAQQQQDQHHYHTSQPSSPAAAGFTMSAPPQESYQMQPTTGTPAPQPARSPPPPFDYPHQGAPSPAISPPPAFDPVAHAPQNQQFAPPPQQQQEQFAPPPQQQQEEFAPPPQQYQEGQEHPYDANGYQQQQAAPAQPEQIHTAGFNNYTAEYPTAPKTPVYTPGGAAGPNGGIHAPGQIGHPNQQLSSEKYHHGLCDCFSDIGTCCTGCWCPCILYSKTYHRLKTVPNSNTADFNACNAPCAMWCLLSPVSWIFTTLQRNRIRENYRLQGSICGDCAKAYCCVACTLVQDDREVAHREEERRRFAGPGSGAVGDTTGYRRAAGMEYA